MLSISCRSASDGGTKTINDTRRHATTRTPEWIRQDAGSVIWDLASSCSRQGSTIDAAASVVDEPPSSLLARHSHPLFACTHKQDNWRGKRMKTISKNKYCYSVVVFKMVYKCLFLKLSRQDKTKQVLPVQDYRSRSIFCIEMHCNQY